MSGTLNSDQQKALKFIKQWWYSDHLWMMLDGSGGTGKSYLIDYVLNIIPGLRPIIIAPTNEALKQIKDKILYPCEFKTIYTALGLIPTENPDGSLSFKQEKLPAFWDNVNICVADEASMYDEERLNLLKQTKCKVIFVGHDKQLPPVNTERKINDSCESPVFKLGLPSIRLRIPQRNAGKLWEFTKLLEERVGETTQSVIPPDFDITRKSLNEYIIQDGTIDLFQGRTQIVSWTNGSVDEYNQRVRKAIFGKNALEEKYLPGDKLILLSTYVSVPELHTHNESSLKSFSRKHEKEDDNYFFTNSKVCVLHAERVLFKFTKSIHIPLYEIKGETEGRIEFFYEPVFKEDIKRVQKYLEYELYQCRTKEQKVKVLRFLSNFRKYFAGFKHFYAATAHRLQGSSIENIILILADMERNPNKIERDKCIYVGASRAMKKLMIYRGIT